MYKTNVPNQTTLPHCYYKGVLGSKPSAIIKYQNNQLTLLHSKQSFELEMTPKQALEFISNFIEKLEKPEFDTPPPKNHFQYGIMGFFSFEFGLKLLNIEVKQENPNCPDFYFLLPTKFKINNQQYEVLNESPVAETKSNLPIKFAPALKSNLTPEEYKQKLELVKEYLKNGETYQVNFAQEFQTTSEKSPEEIFDQLQINNPSPHDALLVTENFSIISNSPECLYEQTGNLISTYPIKGTCPRSEDPKTILDSPKEKAELEMIVDLERNDLGKIATPGSVVVSKHRYIESYTNVHHTISKIDAELPKDTSFEQVISALFPGGSITGCPKKRTSEIIHKLEPSPRGIYCGSLGYIDINQNSQFNILIRSIWKQDQNISFHSGGGITIQSKSENEYEETLAKAENLRKALND